MEKQTQLQKLQKIDELVNNLIEKMFYEFENREPEEPFFDGLDKSEEGLENLDLAREIIRMKFEDLITK